MALSAGTVSIAVKPDTAGFGNSLKSGVLGGTAGVGEGVGSLILGGLKKFAGPIAAVAAGFSVKKFVDESVHAFEDLAGSVKSMQRITGGSVEAVSGLRGAMQLAGVDTSNVTGAITIFSKKLGQAATDSKQTAAMNDLFGQSIKDANGHVKSMADLLPGLADKFKDMPNGAEKTALATQLFGRAGAQMIPVLNKGSEGMAELTQKAKDMGLVLDDAAMKSFGEARESARNFNGAIQGLKVSFGSDMLPVLDAFQNIMRNAVTPVLLATTKFIHEHRDAFLKLADTISGVGSSAMSGLGALLKPLGDAFKQLGPVFLTLAPQIMTLMSAFSPFGLIFKSLEPVLPSIIKLIADLATTLGGTLAGVLAEILPPITDVVKILVGTFGGIMVQLMPAIITLAQTLGGTLGDVIKLLAPVVVDLVKAVASLLPPLLPLIPQIINLAVSAIVPLVQAIFPLVAELLPPLIDLFKFLLPIVVKIAQILEAVLVVAIQIVINILKVIISVVTTVISWFANFIGAIAKAADAVFKWFGGLGDKIMGAIGAAGQWLFSVGQNLIQGLLDGVGSMWNAVSSWIGSLGSKIINGFKSLFGIHSPSTVFFDLGGNITQGLADGLNNGVGDITDAMGNVADAVTIPMVGTPATDVNSGGQSIMDVLTQDVGARNSMVKNLMAGGMSSAKALNWVDSKLGDPQAFLDKALSQTTFTNSAGQNMTASGTSFTEEFIKNAVIPALGSAFKMSNGSTIIYNAAPNDSISSEQKLVDAVQRAKLLGAIA